MLPLNVPIKVQCRPSGFCELKTAEFAHCRVSSFAGRFAYKPPMVLETKLNDWWVCRHFWWLFSRGRSISSRLHPHSVYRGRATPVVTTAWHWEGSSCILLFSLVTVVLVWSRPVLIKNPKSALSETETRPGKNAFDSETRPRPLKNQDRSRVLQHYYVRNFDFEICQVLLDVSSRFLPPFKNIKWK